jgi:hypothetical protein
MSNPKLSNEFRKSQELEETLRIVNKAIHEVTLVAKPLQQPKQPVILLTGNPRSGSTLFFQWLTSSGQFGYPSNLISRFFGNPGFGAAVQKILVDLDKEGQIGIKQQALKFESRLGRSFGAMAPSEFWYFWRRYFNHKDTNKLSSKAMAGFDHKGFLADLAGLESELGLPLAMKGMIGNFDIQFLADLTPQFLFVNISRNLVDTVASILRSRVAYGGSEDVWWSFKPPEYRRWLTWSPVEQVAAQVLSTRQHIRKAFQQIEKNRRIDVKYERFCEAPAETARIVKEFLAPHGVDISVSAFRHQSYEIHSFPGDSAPEVNAIREAISVVRDRLEIGEGSDEATHN